MSQPRFVKRIAPQTMYVGRSPLVPIDWGGRHTPDGELPAALLPHLSGSAILLIGQDYLSIASFA